MPPRPLTHTLASVVALGALVSACGGSEESSPATTASSAAATTSAPAEPAPETTEATVPPETSAPPTTAPPTTAPPTTEAPSTTIAPPESAPPATDPPADLDLGEFCFQSEQTYLAASVVSEIDAPTPAQAEASIRFLVFTAEQSVASAPPGLGDEATRFLEIVREIDAVFARNDYDVAAVEANEDLVALDPLFAEYETIVADELLPFLEQVCTTPTSVIDDQAVKLAAIIDVAREWPLVALTSPAGDIRLLAPLDWSDATGSTEIEEVTFLQATTDAAEFEATWNVPGVFVTVFYVEGGVAEPELRLPSTAAADSCGAPESVEPYSDPIYSGTLHLFTDCAGVGTAAAVATVANADGDVEIVLEFQFPDGPDVELLGQMLAGFAAGA